MENNEKIDLVELITVTDKLRGRLIIDALQDNNVECIFEKEYVNNGNTAEDDTELVKDVKLLVNRQDLEKAKVILQEYGF